jgi:hypothetical protein
MPVIQLLILEFTGVLYSEPISCCLAAAQSQILPLYLDIKPYQKYNLASFLVF